MIKWFIIIIGVVILIPVILVGALYYFIFYQDSALARPITYESEEQAVASGLADMLEGLLGIELDTDQETELEGIVAGFAAGTHDFDDIIDFITDPTDGVMATNPISLTGQRSLALNETQVTALFNLMLGSVDAFFEVDGLSSSNGALAYSVGDLGDLKLSGLGININESDMQIICTVTLPDDIPYLGWLVGGKTIGISLNPTFTIADDGVITIDFNPEGLKLGGISASWPGVSYLVSYLKDNYLSDDQLTQSFNITEPLNSALGSDLGLSFAVTEGQMAFTGPPPLSAIMREIDYGDSTQEEVADAAQAAIDAFTPGDTLTLSEADLTALMTESVQDAIAGGGDTDLGIDLGEDFAVNVNEGGELVMTSTVKVPPGTDLGLPEGSEIEVGLITEVVVDEDGNASLEITGFDLGGLPDETLEELGLDADTLNDALGDAGIDLADALGLPEGALTGLTTDAEGNLILS